ncbi:hypothetical protein H6F44_13525 [Pseudanabaena sp. FACHB-1277]|uniref:Uncharacterized protein n=1 Tax=Pseudanabaena cinerea FACHB-1277 TaxID=2949581 RepID=A0A926Z6X6_9CYAN|nr:hypothetical protein [Pseudanabaena cinerea]MBD2151132.1 hypothetical protein [Pseudanabaena cinerea FACHB-1277]
MTATLIPKASSMPPDPNHPWYRIWQIAYDYAHKKPQPDDLRDRQFFKHIDAIAHQPIASPRYKREIGHLYLFIRKLPYNADKHFRGGRFENPIRDEYENILDSVLAKAIRLMPSEFNPTGKSFTGCFINWVNRRLRLEYELLDFYKKISLDIPNEVSSADSDSKPNLSDLNQRIESDQEKLKKQEAKLLAAFEKDVLENDFWVINYIKDEPKLTYRLLTMRLKHDFCLGREKFQAIVNEFCPIAEDATPEEITEARKYYYSKIDAELRRHVYPKILTRRLIKNLFTPLQIEQIREAIANSESLDIPVYKNYPAITPKFMAEKLLPMFQPLNQKPLTIAEIINLLRSPKYDYLTYKKLDEPKLQQIWDKKCAPKIGKIAAQVLTYSP